MADAGPRRPGWPLLPPGSRSATSATRARRDVGRRLGPGRRGSGRRPHRGGRSVCLCHTTTTCTRPRSQLARNQALPQRRPIRQVVHPLVAGGLRFGRDLVGHALRAAMRVTWIPFPEESAPQSSRSCFLQIMRHGWLPCAARGKSRTISDCSAGSAKHGPFATMPSISFRHPYPLDQGWAVLTITSKDQARTRRTTRARLRDRRDHVRLPHRRSPIRAANWT